PLRAAVYFRISTDSADLLQVSIYKDYRINKKAAPRVPRGRTQSPVVSAEGRTRSPVEYPALGIIQVIPSPGLFRVKWRNPEQYLRRPNDCINSTPGDRLQ